MVFSHWLIFSRGNYDTHCNKRKSDVSGRLLITKKLTLACIVLLVYRSNRRWNWVCSKISYETT